MIGSFKSSNKASRLFCFILVIILLTQVSGFSVNTSDVKVLLEMNDKKIQMGVGTRLSLVLNNVSKKAEVVSFEGLEHFEIMSQSQSSSTSIINGSVTKENRVDYMIMPKNTGTYKLKAKLKIGKDTYETNTLEVTVEEQDQTLSKVKEDIFLKTIVSDNEIYFGESTVVTYELYSRYQVDEYGFTEVTTTDGFIAEENQNIDSRPSYLTINGNKYAKYIVKQLVLSPTQPGEYTVPAYQFQANLSTGSFFGETKPEYLKSEAINLSVIPVPVEGKPKDFTGLTGNLELAFSYNTDAILVNEPVTLDVTLKGKGNLYVLDSIADYMNLSGFSVYETEDEPKVETDKDSHFIEKHFEIILIPKTSQDITIPEMKIPYFNVDTQKYDQLVIGEQIIHVSGEGINDTNNETINKAKGNNQQETLLINQVNYGAYNDDFFVIALNKQKVKMGLVLLCIFLSIGGGLIWYRKKSVPKSVYHSALKKAQNEYELYDILATYLQDQYSISIKSITVEEVEQNLKGHEMAEQISAIINYFEYQRFQNRKPLEDLKTHIGLILQ